MLDEVAAALSGIEADGRFATEIACPSDALVLTVAGVGVIRFPVPTATVRKLEAIAQPAPFGRRSKTLYDKTVRDTGEIGADRITIVEPKWQDNLKVQLERIRRRLGLSKGARLDVVLDKMLVYGPGQFFAPHQDSERSDDMVASLVVELPCQHQGGAIVVQHNGEKKVFSSAQRRASDLSLVAFYADCRHEVTPVEFGHRITLTYHVLSRAPPKERASLRIPASEQLTESIQSYFATPVAPKYGASPAEQPDRLVYLLDHEYTQKSLRWNRLKNGDRLRAGALRQVAEQLDCEAYLALADVHENWSCEEDDWYERSRYRRRRYWSRENEDEDEDQEEDTGGVPDGHRLLELCDSEVELRHFVAVDGSTLEGTVRPPDDEICFNRPSVEMEPFKSEYEGNMGNYGNTMDRWYHRAAVVMWPRQRNFVLRAKASPAWAVKQIAALLKKGSADEARRRADELLPFWAQVAHQDLPPSLVPTLLEVLVEIDDAALASQLLAPLGPHRLTPRCLPPFVTLIQRHALSWSTKLFSNWGDRRHWNTPRWLPMLPPLCEALHAAGKTGRGLGLWLVQREAASFRERLVEARQHPPAYSEHSVAALSDDVPLLLQAAVALRATSVRRDLVALLVDAKTGLAPMVGGEVLQRVANARPPAVTRTLGLQALYGHVVDSLEDMVAAPARSADDWSIEPPDKCRCTLCKELSGFLRSPDHVEFRWPLAKDGRRHIHNTIDSYRLPVTHTTHRQGSPLTLVLTKQKTLFSRDVATRKTQKQLLAWLKKHRGAFVV